MGAGEAGNVKVLYLCDREEDYLEALTEYLRRREEIPWTIKSFASTEDLMDSEAELEDGYLLMEEGAFREMETRPVCARVALLSDRSAPAAEPAQIDKYRSAEDVVRELLEVFDPGPVLVSGGPFLKTRKRVRIIGIYSPVHRCLKTTFALTMGQILAERARTLYLNFESYAGIQELAVGIHDKDLADMLYFLTADTAYFRARFGAMVRRIGALEYIPPMRASQNLLQISREEWLEFLGKLSELEMYDYILLDLSESMQGLFDILRRCSRVYTLFREDRISKAKLLQYEQLLELYAYADVLGKTEKLKTPVISKLSLEAEQYTRGEFAGFVRRQVQELEKGEERE
ncbi:MAG: hypothetical protein K6E92_06905 [Lachnospiraceae bacterium]|nr:hypothetical protein [Lachnospiraceae bacterium]